MSGKPEGSGGQRAESADAPQVLSSSASQPVRGRQIELPLGKAFQISVNSLRIRFWRSVITAGGTFLGIAFLVSVLTQALVDKALPSTMMDATQMMEAANRQIWLVVVSLMVCTVGITNSMLMAVTERYREIGTMKCLGALDKFVVELFLLESLIMGVTASLAGWIVGFLITIVAAWMSHGWGIVSSISLVEAPKMLLMALGVGTLLTIIATIPPAIRAARMPPAIALRSDI
jgi:putative ABC transport system permease protein